MVTVDHLKQKDTSRFFYQIQCSANTDNRTAIVALHGFMGDHRSLHPALSEISVCDVIYCDLPLFGGSDLPEDKTTFHDYAAYLFDKIKEISCKRYDYVFLYGYSMGGRLALYLLCEFPHYFSGGILESAQAGIDSDQKRINRIKLEQKWQRLIADDFDGFLRYWQDLNILRPVHPLSAEQQFRLNEIQHDQSPSLLIQSLSITGTGRMPSLWNKIQTLSLPILLFAGENDEKYSAIAQQLQSKLLDAKTIIFPNCGHRAHLDQPHELALKVTHFLEQQKI